ncbi:hypothetical protein JHK87_004272 [Glycine soja]|nr:hypothetical protein JHK87_004272 [Glycine soja]
MALSAFLTDADDINNNSLDGFSLGTVPVCHGAKHKVLDRRVRITKLVLRCVSLGLGVVAIVLVVTDSQVKEFFSFQKKAKFTDMKALISNHCFISTNKSPQDMPFFSTHLLCSSLNELSSQLVRLVEIMEVVGVGCSS